MAQINCLCASATVLSLELVAVWSLGCCNAGTSLLLGFVRLKLDFSFSWQLVHLAQWSTVFLSWRYTKIVYSPRRLVSQSETVRCHSVSLTIQYRSAPRCCAKMSAFSWSECSSLCIKCVIVSKSRHWPDELFLRSCSYLVCFAAASPGHPYSHCSSGSPDFT